MRILPELETYRDRLMARASAWGVTPRDDLDRDLKHCLDQVSLIEKGLERLRSRPPEETTTHREEIQGQMRDLTAAYAEALRRHLEKLVG